MHVTHFFVFVFLFLFLTLGIDHSILYIQSTPHTFKIHPILHVFISKNWECSQICSTCMLALDYHTLLDAGNRYTVPKSGKQLHPSQQLWKFPLGTKMMVTFSHLVEYVTEKQKQNCVINSTKSIWSFSRSMHLQSNEK